MLVVAAAALAFVFGFAYGDLLGGQYGFHFQEWQTLGGQSPARAERYVMGDGAVDTFPPFFQLRWSLLDMKHLRGGNHG